MHNTVQTKIFNHLCLLFLFLIMFCHMQCNLLNETCYLQPITLCIRLLLITIKSLTLHMNSSILYSFPCIYVAVGDITFCHFFSKRREVMYYIVQTCTVHSTEFDFSCSQAGIQVHQICIM